MTKNEFIDKYEDLVRRYCWNNQDYEDIDDSFDYCHQQCCYTARLTIISENYGDDEE